MEKYDYFQFNLMSLTKKVIFSNEWNRKKTSKQLIDMTLDETILVFSKLFQKPNVSKKWKIRNN